MPALLFVLASVAFRSLLTEDLTFWDEAAYISRGLDASNGVWPRFADGAIYSDFYWLLSHVVTDPVSLYFAGRAITAMLLVLGVWTAARLLVRPPLAWVAAAVVATSPLPYVWPGVATPAAAAVIVGFAIALRSTGAVALGLVAGLFWIAAGARPEFAWLAATTSALALGMLAFQTLRRPHKWNATTVLAVGSVVLGALVVPLMLVRLHGSPFDSNNRDWVAFAQHYSQRHAEAGEDPWLDAADIVARSFGTADSVLAALSANTGAFLQHVSGNLMLLPSAIYRQSLGLSLGGLRDGSIGSWMVVVLVVSLVTSLVLSGGWKWRRLQAEVLRAPRGRDWVRVLIAAGVAAAIFIPSAIIYPRTHYLVIPASLLVILLVLIQDRLGSQRLTVVLPFLVTVVLLAAWTFQTAGLAVRRASHPAPMALVASRMAEMDQTWRLLAIDWGLSVYVPRLSQVESPPQNTLQSFEDYLAGNDINAVLINDRFNSAPWRELPGFEAFTSDPGQFGFTQVSPDSHVWIRTPGPASVEPSSAR